MRSGWKETLSLLSDQSIPLFVFSSGYGDLVANALLQSGLILESPGPTGPHMKQSQQQVCLILLRAIWYICVFIVVHVS